MPKVQTSLRDKPADEGGLLDYINRELSKVVREARRALNILGGDWVEVTEDHVVALGERIVYADATDGALTMTLPDALDASDYQFTVKKTDASANAVTVAADAIEGSTSVSLASQYDYVRVHSNGTTYYVVGG